MLEGNSPIKGGNGASYTSLDFKDGKIQFTSWPILEALSIVSLCPSAALPQDISFTERPNPQKIDALKKSFSSMFSAASRDLEVCSQERRNEFFSVLAKELFDNFNKFPSLQAFYFELCIEHLKIDISTFKPNKFLIESAEKAALESGYTQEWHESHMSQCLSRDFRFSDQWCNNRVTFLEDKLLRREEIVNLSQVLHTTQFEGVTDFLISNLECFADLKFSYLENLLSSFAKEDFNFNPAAVYHSLMHLGELAYLENPDFKQARDECLKAKFQSGYIGDIHEFLAFYERNSLHPLDFTPKDQDFFDDLRYEAANALTRSVSLGDTSLHKAHSVISQVFLQEELYPNNTTILKDFRRAVHHGTAFILNHNDRRIDVDLTPLDLFISLLPSKHIFGTNWGQDLGNLAYTRIRRAITCYNVQCDELQDVKKSDLNNCSAKLKKQIQRLHNEFLPFIERIPYYLEVFGIRNSLLRIKPLPTEIYDHLAYHNDYSPGQFTTLFRPQAQYSLLSWHRNKITFQRKFNSKEFIEADLIAHGLVELAIDGISPESLCTLISKLPGATTEYREGLRKYEKKAKRARSLRVSVNESEDSKSL